MRKVGELLSCEGGGGAGLVVDYGGDRVFGSSFRVSPETGVSFSMLTLGSQAFRNHKIVDVFEEPGSADLTANVDFAYLRESLSGLGSFSICFGGLD